MAQYRTGTVDVTNGSQTVTGNATAWLANVEPGDIFTLTGGSVWYEIASVDSDTQLTLAANFAGNTQEEADYAITRDFSPQHGYPLPSAGDIEVARLLARAINEIDAEILVKEMLSGNGGDIAELGEANTWFQQQWLQEGARIGQHYEVIHGPYTDDVTGLELDGDQAGFVHRTSATAGSRGLRTRWRKNGGVDLYTASGDPAVVEIIALLRDNGIQFGNPAGGLKGPGTANIKEVYQNNEKVLDDSDRSQNDGDLAERKVTNTWTKHQRYETAGPANGVRLQTFNFTSPGSDTPQLIKLIRTGASETSEAQRVFGRISGARNQASSARSSFMMDVFAGIGSSGAINAAMIAYQNVSALNPFKLVTFEHDGQTWLGIDVSGSISKWYPNIWFFDGYLVGDNVLEAIARSVASNIQDYADDTSITNYSNMPQVGGVPVVESDANDDGRWTRWADGTQAVYAEDAHGDVAIDEAVSGAHRSVEFTKPYPKSFASLPVGAGVHHRAPAQNGAWVIGGRDDAAHWTYRAMAVNSVTIGSLGVSMSAMGWWK